MEAAAPSANVGMAHVEEDMTSVERPSDSQELTTKQRSAPAFSLPTFDPSSSTSSLLDAVVGPGISQNPNQSFPLPVTRAGGHQPQQPLQFNLNHPYQRHNARTLPAPPPSSFPSPLVIQTQTQAPVPGQSIMERKPSLTASSSSASSRSRFSRLSRSEAMPGQSPAIHGQDDSDSRSKADSSEWDILSEAGSRLNEGPDLEEEEGRVQELLKKVERR